MKIYKVFNEGIFWFWKFTGATVLLALNSYTQWISRRLINSQMQIPINLNWNAWYPKDTKYVLSFEGSNMKV